MASDQPTLAVQASVPNSGLQPVVPETVNQVSEPLKVPPSLLNQSPIIPQQTHLTPKPGSPHTNMSPIILQQTHSSPKPVGSPHTNTHTPPSSNSHKRDIILVVDSEDTNKAKQVKLEPRAQEISPSDIEELKKQIEAEEAKLKMMRQMQVQKVIVTTHSPHITTVPTTYANSSQNKMRSKPIIIHGANDPNRNMFPAKKSYLNSPDNHKSNNIIITRPDSDTNKHLESKPTIIHGTMHKDKMLQPPQPVDAISPNGLEPEEFKELQELQSKIKAITQKYTIPMPTAKHNNLFLSKHNNPKKQLSKMIERKLIKAQLPPTNRQVWPIIPFSDNNFQYAVGLEEAVLYVTGEPDESSELHKKNRIVCIGCGCDFGSWWQGSKSAFYCEACDSARQMKGHRSALVTHLNLLMKDVDSDEKEFDRYIDILLKQQTRLQQTQQQQQQQQQQTETYILSQLSDGKYHLPSNAITFSTASGQRINTGTVIHQKQDNVQYVALNTTDNTKLQPIAGFFLQPTSGEKNKNGQVNTTQLRNVLYTTQVDSKQIPSLHKK